MPSWSCVFLFIKYFAWAKSHSWWSVIWTTEPKSLYQDCSLYQGWKKHTLGRQWIVWYSCDFLKGQISNHIFNTQHLHFRISWVGNWCAVSGIPSACFVWKEWLLYITHVDIMEFSCWDGVLFYGILWSMDSAMDAWLPFNNQWPWIIG